MLHFKILNRNIIKLDRYDLNLEKEQLFSFFKKRSKKADFNKLVELEIWDGLDSFITKNGEISIELWKEIFNFSNKTNIEVDLKEIKTKINTNFNKEQYTSFVNKLFSGIKTDKGEVFYPRDYQFEGAYRALKYKFCCQELATSSGKTAIFYIYNSYLRYTNIINNNNKALLIVPNVSLVNQTKKAFEQYSNGLVKWKIQTLGGSNGKFDFDEFLESNMLITTYQSLINLIPICIDKKLTKLIKKRVKKEDKEKRAKEIFQLKQKLDQFKGFNISSYFKVVNVDEAHKSRGNSISDILKSCNNWEYKLGLSGTLKIDEQYSDFFKMQENIGPLVMTLGADFLIDNEYSPNIKIKPVFLEYPLEDKAVFEYLRIQNDKELRKKIKDQFDDPKEFGKYLLNIEKSIIFSSKTRITLISKLIQRFNKNTLVLFSDIKNEYGISISNEINTWSKNTFYIDGEVDTSSREEYKRIMEEEEGTVIVASYGTFATGIDLKNVHHIVFAESVKAEITIRQAIGRGMRYLKGKNEVVIWDIIDALDGYSVKHSEKRNEIYKQQKFTILSPKNVKI
jgi:superfamily II DNA or RNA helicase